MYIFFYVQKDVHLLIIKKKKEKKVNWSINNKLNKPLAQLIKHIH